MAASTNANALLASANSLQPIASELSALQVQIYLLQQLAGNSMTPQQLLTQANGLQLIADPLTARRVIIYLLTLVA